METEGNRMIPLDKALRIICDVASPLPAEQVVLADAYARVLAEDVVADTDIPPFDKAAMDGFACRKADVGNQLRQIEEIPAGKVAQKRIGPDECAAIMTGAMIPAGADFILMKEHAEKSPDGIISAIHQSDQSNICLKGEDIRKGDIVLKKGTRLGPAHLAVLASAGTASPLVYALPRICIISTGSELVEPGVFPGPGKIRNSNGIQLISQAKEMGMSAVYKGIVADDQQALTKMISAAFNHFEIILVSGGVSVGDYDFIPATLQHLGAEILFHGLQVKPGKHMLFARKNGCYIAGMPGNPVSSFVMFALIVKALINRLSGNNGTYEGFRLPAGDNFRRKKGDVLLLVPATIHTGGFVTPLEYHGSAHIQAYTLANAMMEIPAGVSEIRKGEMVYVRPV